jgi:multidrug efflux pump subunit AcrA (membrane-fusion protein)
MPVHLRHDSVVPPLRRDLNVLSPPTGTGAEVIDIHPLDSDDSMPMRGFELSIALMLDGKRTADEVIFTCARLGLPLSLEALEGFVRELEAHRLLGSGALKVRRTRGGWSPHLRELYRSALRAAREGDRDAARALAGQMLQLSPGMPEAVRFREWLDEHVQDASEFEQAWHDSVDHWVHPKPPPLWKRVWAQVRADPMVPFVALLAALVTAAALFIPLPRVTAAHAQLLPVNQVSVFAENNGVVGQIAVRNGDTVVPGSVLYQWSADDLQLRLLDVNEALDEARRPLRDRALYRPRGEPVLMRLRRAEAALARAQTGLLREQRESAGGDEDSELSTPDPEGHFAMAWEQVQTANEGLDLLVEPGTPEALRIGALVEQVRVLRERLAHRVVTAELAGVVSGLSIREGQSVFEGEGLMRIDDRSRMRVVAMVTPRQARSFHAGEKVEIAFGSARRTAVIEGVFGYEVVAEVDNRDGALEVGTELVHLEREPRSLVRLFLR